MSKKYYSSLFTLAAILLAVFSTSVSAGKPPSEVTLHGGLMLATVLMCAVTNVSDSPVTLDMQVYTLSEFINQPDVVIGNGRNVVLEAGQSYSFIMAAGAYPYTRCEVKHLGDSGAVIGNSCALGYLDHDASQACVPLFE